MNSEMICVVPARGGSERLPRKNIKSLDGKPMIAYSIEAAQETGLFENVYVATDDQEIAEVARDYGATVPYLMPNELCGGLMPSHKPAQHLAESIADDTDSYDSLLLLQPTSPLRTPEDITRGVEMYLNGSYDFVVSATHIDPHYFHWAMRERDDGFWEMHFGDEYMKERPLLPPRYRPNGSVKIAQVDTLAAEGNFFGKQCGVFETPERRSIHVGTQLDFDIANGLLGQRDTEWGQDDDG